MAMTRVKYGVEFSRQTDERDGSSGFGWIVVAVLVIAAVAFIVHRVNRLVTSEPDGGPGGLPPPGISAPVQPPAAPSVRLSDTNTIQTAQTEVAPPLVNDFTRRTPKTQNLLLRLRKAEQEGDLEMQISTIEQLRALPGGAVADIDDRLVDKLGELNFRWLYERKNPQWVTEVAVKRGDTAVRIAQECGSTFGSLKRLNTAVDFERLQVGTRLKVMNHPSFTLIVHKRLRSVELLLNGKLFKRYLLPNTAPEIPMEPGGYRTPANLREYFRHNGIGLSAEDAAEIDQLVPRETPLRVSPS